jgi:hypothetical protein
MDLLSLNELKNLITKQNEIAISIYIPTDRSGDKVLQGPIRLKNQIQKAEQLLQKRGYKAGEANKLLAPAKELLEGKTFWFHQSDGLAIFISPDDFFYYRFPLKFKETVIINKRFYIKPVYPLMTGDGRFFLLALDLNEVKLYEGSRYSLSKITLPDGTFTKLDDLLEYEEPIRSLQFRTGTPSTAGNKTGVGGGAMFHSHGTAGNDDSIQKEKILEFFHHVDNGVFKTIRTENNPLLIAGVEYLIPIYRKANSYSHTMPESLDLNPEDLTIDELHEKAWEIVGEHFNQSRQTAWEKFEQLLPKQKAAVDIEEILKNAFQNRVESLFLNLSDVKWGTFDPAKYEVNISDQPNNSNEDLLDLAAAFTTLNGGQVYAVQSGEFLNGKSAAAVFRF